MVWKLIPKIDFIIIEVTKTHPLPPNIGYAFTRSNGEKVES